LSSGPAELLHVDQTASTGESGPAADLEGRSALRLVAYRLRRDWVTLLALGVVVGIALVAILASLIVKVVGAHPPNQQNIAVLDKFGDPSGPSRAFLFGTDDLGRDVFSRTLYGARISLEVTLIATAIIILVGVAFGLLAGYYRGWGDTLISRSFDVVLAFPVLLLALGLGAACTFGRGCVTVNYKGVGVALMVLAALVIFLPATLLFREVRHRSVPAPRLQAILLRTAPGLLVFAGGLALIVSGNSRGALIQPGLPVIIFILALAGIPYMGRIVRGQVLSLREREFVEALRALGASDSRIMLSHILPNLVPSILVYATVLIPQNILLAAALSFLGIGVQPPTADWGTMIAGATSLFRVAWWYMTFPGLALLITVLAFNLLGDGLQDALMPRRGR
jgi:peptide/nickel transport system permease protein